MKLTRNVTETTALSLNANVKADIELLAEYTNRTLDEVVNIAIDEFLKQNRDHFAEHMIIEAFSELSNMEVGETCFCSPRLDVTGRLLVDAQFEIEIEIKDDQYNVIETIIEHYKNKEALSERLLFLFHDRIGYGSEYAHRYINERLSRPVLIQEVM